MTGELFIDNIDAYTAWGIGVVRNGYAGIVGMPPLKSYQSNDWQEEDGIEADLSAPVLNTREFSMDFYCTKGMSSYNDFLREMADGGYHTFDCREIGRTFRLRLVSHSKYDILNPLQTLTVKFADDFPLPDYEYLAPSPVSFVLGNSDYLIDGKSFTNYGVYVVQGSLAEVMKGPTVKTALLRNIPTQAGAIYDGDATPRHKAKDVKLSCVLRAESLTQMWRNWDALLYDLTTPEAKRFVSSDGVMFLCCYKSCSVKEFDTTGHPWLSFTLTLTNLSGVFKYAPPLRLITTSSLALYHSGGQSVFKFINR